MVLALFSPKRTANILLLHRLEGVNKRPKARGEIVTSAAFKQPLLQVVCTCVNLPAEVVDSPV